MSDYYEIDLWDVQSAKSGDAISFRSSIDGETVIHVIDAGFQSTGQKVVDSINKYYDSPQFIHSVVVTHPDGDHAGGLRTVLEEFDVGALWMLRPWNYAAEMIDRFENYNSVDRLISRLKKIYPNLAALEEIALANNIPIYEPFQGEGIGDFTVLAPSKSRYLDLVVQSEKTPEHNDDEVRVSISDLVNEAIHKTVSFFRAAWGEEVFSPEETSAENEMSVVQYACILDEKIVLTGDAGRTALIEAADFAEQIGITLSGIKKFQIPHHGSRRNVSTDVLDRWLGPRLSSIPQDTQFTALISAAREDEHHPKKSVVRAAMHRGGFMAITNGQNIRSGKNAPARDGYSPLEATPYPDDQEA